MFRLAVSALPLLAATRTVAQTQAPGVQWERTFGGPCLDRAAAVREADDGGFVAAGMTMFADDPLAIDLYLVKTDAEGTLLWERRYGGPWVDQALDMDKTSDGGFIITGVTDGTDLCGLECIESRWDVYLLRVDGQGEEVWQRTFGGNGADSGHAVRETQDGSFIVAGITNSFGAGLADVYLLKVDAEGNLGWEQTFGGEGHDRAYAVEQTEDGGYLLVGRTAAQGRPDDVLMLRTERSGNLLWQRTFGGPRYDVALGVEKTRDGGFAVTGISAESDSVEQVDLNAFVLKTDGTGNLVWETRLAQPLHQAGSGIVEAADGALVIAGVATDGFVDQSYVLSTDSEGNLLWESLLSGPGSNFSPAVWPTSDGGYILAGSATLPIPPPVCDPTELYLAKLGPSVVTSHPFIRGDTDRNGEVNLRDAELVLSHLFFVYPFPRLLPCPDAGDIDDDGTVQINDAIYLLNHLFRRAPPPPPPYPEMAADPTADKLGC
jgi:hypothetical protein